MNIRLIRHAESAGNAENRWTGRKDLPLSETGRWQADMLRSSLEDEGYIPTHIYASPLSRAFETATIVSSAWSCSIEPWDDLVEIDVGAFSDLTATEIEERFPSVVREFVSTRNFDIIEGAETHIKCIARAVRVVDRLVRIHGDNDRVMLFSHGGIMHHIISRLLGTEQVWHFEIDNTAIFEFTIDVGGWNLDPRIRTNMQQWNIVRFGDTRHLDTSSM